MALGLGVLVMTTFLVWYYKHALAQPRREQPSTQARAANSAMALPLLGRIDPPLVERVLGPAPAPPEEAPLTQSHAMLWPEERFVARSRAPLPGMTICITATDTFGRRWLGRAVGAREQVDR